jgi:hypothetical protein
MGMRIAVLSALVVICACNEPVKFVPPGEDAENDTGVTADANNGVPDMDGDMVGGVDSSSDGGGDGATVICEPTLERYTEVYPRVQGTCGTVSCHGGSGFQYRVPDGSDRAIISDSYDSAEAFWDEDDCLDPDGSELLAIPQLAREDAYNHPTVPRVQELPGYLGLRFWLQEGLTIVEPDVGMDVPEDSPLNQPFPCDGLPTRGGLPYSYPFEDCPPGSSPCATFVEHVNPLLMRQCATDNCHGDRGNGMYLLTGQDDCVARWNYFSAYWYITHADPLDSPLLVRPTVDDLDETHAGLGTLGSADDACERQTIRKWLVPTEFDDWQACSD